jgi:membrane associated rhomboid family serine protease
MIPLRDNIPSRRFPGVTVGIIALNLLVFFQELRMGSHLEQFMLVWGIVPARFTDAAQFFHVGEKILPLFGSMFLHGGWLHLIGNMWVLWIFGDNVEDRLGHFKYLGFYLLSGIAAAVLHICTNLHSTAPTIGASGAIAGVMGAYFRFFPRARVETLIPPFFFGPFFELPAVVFLGFWFFLQFYNGALSLSLRGQTYGGVAWWAHVGGFAFGVLITLGAGRTRELEERGFR